MNIFDQETHEDGKMTPLAVSDSYVWPEVTMRTKWGKDNIDRILGRESVEPEDSQNPQRNMTAFLDPFKGAISSVFLEGEKVQELEFSEDKKGILSINVRDRTVIESGRKKVLLKDIRLDITDGEMVLILAGSGAGKSTFLNAVNGEEKANASILYGGIDLYKDFSKLKHYITTVPQSNILRFNDTVYMTLLNAAQLKLPREYTDDKEKLEQKIQEVLETVNLTKQSAQLVSKLSGGQQRRLLVAQSYISDPYIFFLDEADSGLDSSQAKSVMANLRAIADKGKIVILITHSPDRAMDLFDKVMVLAKSSEDGSGRLAFFGTPKEALEFFEVNSLEDIVGKVDGISRDENKNVYNLADVYIARYSEMQSSKEGGETVRGGSQVLTTNDDLQDSQDTE